MKGSLVVTVAQTHDRASKTVYSCVFRSTQWIKNFSEGCQTFVKRSAWWYHDIIVELVDYMEARTVLPVEDYRREDTKKLSFITDDADIIKLTIQD